MERRGFTRIELQTLRLRHADAVDIGNDIVAHDADLALLADFRGDGAKHGMPARGTKGCADDLGRQRDQLIADHVDNHSDASKMAGEFVDRVTDKTPEEIAQANASLRKYLELIIGVGQVFQDLAAKFTEAGHKIEGIKSLDDAMGKWERVREELPERFALAFSPVRSAIRKRIERALTSPPRATDWRSLFQ